MNKVNVMRESEKLEFKESVTEDIYKGVIAFANGGKFTKTKERGHPRSPSYCVLPQRAHAFLICSTRLSDT
jgi:hypothetical protein